MKIGRVRFAVKEIKVEQNDQAGSDQNDAAKVEVGHSSNSVFMDSKQDEFEEFVEVPAVLDQREEDGEAKGCWCRFCWSGEATEANPLLGTCACKGTVSQIHFECLRSWLNIRR